VKDNIPDLTLEFVFGIKFSFVKFNSVLSFSTPNSYSQILIEKYSAWSKSQEEQHKNNKINEFIDLIACLVPYVYFRFQVVYSILKVLSWSLMF